VSDRPELSWLLPVRDGAAFLRGAVDSALAESGPADELIVVDDGSVDAPAAVLPADRRVRLLRQGPRGIAAALETGRAAARGRFLARIDADDRVLPGRVAAQRAAFAADPSLVAVGGGVRLHRAGAPAPAGMARWAAWMNENDPMVERLVESPLVHPATTFRADAVAAVGGWRQGDFPEDYDLLLRLAAAGGRLGRVPGLVLEMEDRPARLTRTDPRYRPAAFAALRQAHLDAVGPPGPVTVLGGGSTAAAWVGWAQARGRPVRVIGPRPGVAVGGVPAEGPAGMGVGPPGLVLVAIGVRDVRETVVAAARAAWPALRLGVDLWPVG